MCVIQNPLINNNAEFTSIFDNVHAASHFISIGDGQNASNYLGLASASLNVMKNRGIENQKTRELSSMISSLNHRVIELYERQKQLQIESRRYVVEITKTLFPIRVTYDAGFGNTIELRGSKAAGLSWEQGKALVCKGDNRWELDLDFEGSFEYKLTLLNRNGSIVWEKLEGNKNRVFSIHDRTVVDYLKPITPLFDRA